MTPHRAVLFLCLITLLTLETAAASRSRIVRATAPMSSAELIDEALRTGQIDSETALVYRVLADFDDPRLPERFRGFKRTRGMDTFSLADARVQFDALSEGAKEIVSPFLIPPFHQGSWANLQSDRVARNIRPAAVAVCGPVMFGDWSSILSGSGSVRIWWNDDNPGDAAVASGLATAADKAMLLYTSLLGRSHIPDGGSTGICRGGDDAIDVALVDAHSQTVPFAPGTKEVSSYVLLERNAADGVEMTLAHELFHVFQYTYDVQEFGVHTHYKWMMEATAAWAQHHYSPPADSGKEHRAAPLFLQDPELPLDTVDRGREYGAYLFFLYLSQRYGNETIRNIWNATISNDSLNAINSIISGGFRERWPEFALYNWNSGPVDHYKQWDSLTAQASAAERRVVLGGSSDLSEQASIDLPRLSATYYRYVFDDPNARYISWYNGLTFRLSKKHYIVEGEDYGELFFVAEADEAATEGAKIQALIKIGGVWRTDDWTDKSLVTFCRQQPDQRIEELVIVYSNSQFRDQNKRLTSQVEKPLVVVSNVGCSRWKGSVTNRRGDIHPASFTISGTDLVFEYSGRMMGPADGAAGTPILGSQYRGSGTMAMRVSGTDENGCTYQGQKDFSFTSTAQDNITFLVVVDNAPPGSAVYRTYWAAHGFANPTPLLATYTMNCPDDDGPTTVDTIAGPWFAIPMKEERVDRSGTRLVGDWSPSDDGEDRYEWDFTTFPP